MLARRENRCRRFQANVFNKSKCQNCFKPVDSHTLSESDLYGTKPVRAGWLLIAPEGINFASPTHKKRKWQRRYFILYEHGLLRYALDEMPGTLPQGSVNMLHCCEVLEASLQTGFRNTLQLCFSDRDYYIRTENGASIAGWQENLMLHLNTAKTIQKKKRREQTHTPSNTTCSITRASSPYSPRPSVSVVCSTADTRGGGGREVSGGGVGVHNSADRSGEKSAHVDAGDGGEGAGPEEEAAASAPCTPRAELQEEEVGHVWRAGVALGNHPASPDRNCRARPLKLLTASSMNDVQSRGGVDSGYSSLEKTRRDFQDVPTAPDPDPRSPVVGRFAKTRDVYSSSFSYSSEQGDQTRSSCSTAQVLACDPEASASTCQRSRSLERSIVDHTPTPDLLNFKKGWLSRQEEGGGWRKHWFVLTDQSLRFYRDAVAEEAGDAEGDIDLSSCYEVTPCPVQKNYSFQIHTKDSVFTLCAMTSGIRRNWIQAVVNNVRPAVAPDVTCSGPGREVPPPSDARRPDKRSRISEWRKEGRYKTFDWAEFSHSQKKREEFTRGAGRRSDPGETVPPAPVSSPEEPIASRIGEERVQSERTWRQKGQRRAHRLTQTVELSLWPSRHAASDRREGEEGGEGGRVGETQMKLISVPSLSSTAVQTEWQWEEEFQNLEAEYERSGRELRDSEARLQTELRACQDRLREAESRLKQSEASVRDLQDERRHLERQLRLLQDTQEQERRSLSDSLDQSERRVQELEERLRNTEAELRRRCQELQSQLEEADGEVGRLQERLQGEETLHYDMEHEFERVCEELEGVRGALHDCERVCEERYSAHLQLQQQQLARKEQELQELTLKMAALLVGLEESERRLVEVQRHLQEGLPPQDGLAEAQGLLGSPDRRRITTTILGGSDTQMDPRSQRVISVMQALESKLCETEERLCDITVRLQRQALEGGAGLSAPPQGRGSDTKQPLGVPLDDPSAGGESVAGADVSLAVGALILHRMASALEQPSGELLQRLSELRAPGRGEPGDGTPRETSSWFLPLLQQEATLEEHDVCVMAELAYLTSTLHTHSTDDPLPASVPSPVCLHSESDPEQGAFCSGNAGLHGAEGLVAELRAQARTLQCLSAGACLPPELPPPVLRMALFQATLAYVASRVHSALHQQCSTKSHSVGVLFREQAQCHECKLHESRQAIERAEQGRVSVEADAQMRGRDVQWLEAELDEKLRGAPKQIHEEEMSRLHGCCSPRQSSLSMTTLQQRIRELETQVKQCSEAYEQELEVLKGTCELGFTSMAQSHRRVVEELQRQHQMEVERLSEQREKVLQEEAHATMTAIEAISKAHKEELERSRKVQEGGARTDLSKQRQHAELESVHRELEVLSQQYSLKCVENTHLKRVIEEEREALVSTTKENQAHRTHSEELNKRLVAELSLLQSHVRGGGSYTQLSVGRDVYHLEVIVRVKESEIECLKQEINSLKDELQDAHRHSKELLNELSVLRARFPGDRVKGRAEDGPSRTLTHDVLRSRSNPNLVKDRTKRNRLTRSKSLTDGLSVQERMKLFEADNRKK